MPRTIALLAVLAGALLLSAPNAQAGWKVDRAQAIAEHVWNYDYGCDFVQIKWADPAQAFSRTELAADLARDREVIAWTNPTALAPARCVVYLNAPRAKLWGTDWTETCSAMIHEYGHLAGLGHSTNPRSIMYPDYRPDRRCRKHGRPYLDRYNLL